MFPNQGLPDILLMVRLGLWTFGKMQRWSIFSADHIKGAWLITDDKQTPGQGSVSQVPPLWSHFPSLPILYFLEASHYAEPTLRGGWGEVGINLYFLEWGMSKWCVWNAFVKKSCLFPYFFPYYLSIFISYLLSWPKNPFGFFPKLLQKNPKWTSWPTQCCIGTSLVT